MACYREWASGRGWVEGVGGLEAGRRLNRLLGLFGLATYESQKCQPYAQTCLDGIKDISLSTFKTKSAKQRVIKVVSKDESCMSFTCHKPELASSLVKKLKVKYLASFAHFYTYWLNNLDIFFQFDLDISIQLRHNDNA